MASQPKIEVADGQIPVAAYVPGRSTQEYANYSRLVARVVDVFGDEIKAAKWLSLPNADLHGETPLQTAQHSDYAPETLETILTRIEHGIDF